MINLPNANPLPPSPSELPAANTTTYNWYFVCDEGPSCSGSGQLITDVAIGPATVISLTGTILGEPILGLFGLDEWWRNDNLIISLTDEILNEGISGFTENWYFNLYLSLTEGAGDSILICDASTARLERRCNRTNVYGQNTYYTDYARGEFSAFIPDEVTPIPLPGALPLLASGLAAFGFIGWRRKRRAVRVS